jgi:alpha-galactosidase
VLFRSSGVGSWSPNKKKFPRGLKPLGDAIHKAGMKFLVWFEPERVHRKSEIGKKHKEWVFWRRPKASLRGTWYSDNGLFNFGNDQAREWLTNKISALIRVSGIDIYRNDFNINPHPFWTENENRDRQGINEIKYIEGLYRFFEELPRRHPGLWVDNCASGGRRIDLETMARSIPLTQSDTVMEPHPDWDQSQHMGLNHWIPVHSTLTWAQDLYHFRSGMTNGSCLNDDIRKKSFPTQACKKWLTEVKKIRPYFLGDFYPFFPVSTDTRQWSGYQLHRGDLDGGMVLLFRRGKSPFIDAELTLKGLLPGKKYKLKFEDSGKTVTRKGGELSKLYVRMDKPPSSMLITYKGVD